MNKVIKVIFVLLVVMHQIAFASFRGVHDALKSRYGSLDLEYSPFDSLKRYERSEGLAFKRAAMPDKKRRASTPDVFNRLSTSSPVRESVALDRSPSTPVDTASKVLPNGLSPERSTESDSMSPESRSSLSSSESLFSKGGKRKVSFVDLMRLRVKDTSAEDEARRKAEEATRLKAEREKYIILRQECWRLEDLKKEILQGSMQASNLDVLELSLQIEQIHFEMMKLREHTEADLFFIQTTIQQLQKQIEELQLQQQPQEILSSTVKPILVTKRLLKNRPESSHQNVKSIIRNNRKGYPVVTFVRTEDELRRANRHFYQTKIEDYLL